MTVGEPRNGKDIMYDAVSGACAGMPFFSFCDLVCECCN